MINRSLFTPDGISTDAPAGISPTMSVPSERMANLLCDLLETNGKVLEIGTGSGYQTAVLSERCHEVVSLELQPLHEVPAKLPGNVTLITANGCSFDCHEEFDGILVTFAAPKVFDVWVKQLKEGGRLVVPLRVGSCCRITVYTKQDGKLKYVDTASYAHFTPMVNL